MIYIYIYIYVYVCVFIYVCIYGLCERVHLPLRPDKGLPPEVGVTIGATGASACSARQRVSQSYAYTHVLCVSVYICI